MMKKKLAIFIIAVLCLMTAVGGTMAYYSSGVTSHNVVRSGNVTVKLLELGSDNAAEFESLENAMAGLSYAKVLKVENIGSAAAWVRISLEKTVHATGEKELDPDMISFDINTEDWTERDGWFYYNTALEPGAETVPLMASISFDRAMGNEWQGAQLSLDVHMQAVQTANNGAAVFDAAGWSD